MKKLRLWAHQIKEVWVRMTWDQRLSLSFEGVIAGATILYVLVALLQRSTMNDQLAAMRAANKQTKMALEVAQSPYVFVVEINAAPLKIGEKVTGTIQFVNTGNLPAQNFIFTGQFEIRPDCPTNINGKVAANINQFDMAPNLSNYADQPPEDISSPAIVSTEEFESFSNKASKLCAYGMYWYRTGFESPDGSEKFVIQPFCQWTDSVTTKFRRCPVLNTQFKEIPLNAVPK